MKYKVGDEVLVKGSIVKIECEEYDACPVAVGFDKGRSEWYAEEELIPAGKTYTQGLADAWELAKKIVLDKDRGGFSCSELESIFDTVYPSDILEELSCKEVLAKIEAYEKEKEIKVGDVVKNVHNGMEYIVLDTESGRSINTKFTAFDSLNIGSSAWKKTGKHIDIELLLRQIGE